MRKISSCVQNLTPKIHQSSGQMLEQHSVLAQAVDNMHPPSIRERHVIFYFRSKQKFMGKQKEKIQEPYSPDHTPEPPQIIDPSRGEQPKREPDPNMDVNKKEDRKKPSDAESKKEKKPKLLGESETEIEDETTI
jgi:hypothetical protein